MVTVARTSCVRFDLVTQVVATELLSDFGGVAANIDSINFEAFDDGTNQLALSYERTGNLIRAWTDFVGGTEAAGDISGNVFRAVITGTLRSVENL